VRFKRWNEANELKEKKEKRQKERERKMSASEKDKKGAKRQKKSLLPVPGRERRHQLPPAVHVEQRHRPNLQSHRQGRPAPSSSPAPVAVAVVVAAAVAVPLDVVFEENDVRNLVALAASPLR